METLLAHALWLQYCKWHITSFFSVYKQWLLINRKLISYTCILQIGRYKVDYTYISYSLLLCKLGNNLGDKKGPILLSQMSSFSCLASNC